MSLSAFDYLRHILGEAEYLMNESQALGKSASMKDETLKRAFVRSLEIIGGASKKIPVDFKQKHSHIEWRAIAGMRDKLIHAYFGVDYDIIWDVVENKIPVLRQQIEYIMQDEV